MLQLSHGRVHHLKVRRGALKLPGDRWGRFTVCSMQVKQSWIQRISDIMSHVTTVKLERKVLIYLRQQCFVWSLSRIFNCLHFSHQSWNCSFREVSFPRKSHFPESHIYWEITFPGKSHFPGSHIFRQVTFPGKSNLPGSQISWEVIFPGKSYFPWSCISQKVAFPGKSHFPCPVKLNFPTIKTAP